jgi:gliding motility-associated-like protein
MKTRLTLLTACLCLLFLNAKAQKDTLFWFVAPEAAQNHGDRPILFRFATFNQAATIRIEQPANPNFPVQTLNLGPNSAQSIDLTQWITMIENDPPNTVLTHGFRIRSSAPITAYYEINPGCGCNPDIFTLKGKNALGTQFLLPFQNFFSNANYARSGFDIVATENNTTITITPTRDIVGHGAGQTFSILLNQGETWNGRAVSTAANQHLEGTSVVSDKPIAITINDDSMNGAPYGGCKDIMGDQMVPIPVIGDEYIVVKGYLNGPDKVFVLASQNGTTVQVDGTTVATLQAGETYAHTLANPVAYIQTSSPSYVLHATGFGCEVGGALLPTIECTGSSSVSFTRSTNEFFAMNVIVQTGGEGNFNLNGNTNWVSANAFQPVPGSNGAWMYAQINLSNQVPSGQASRLTNSSHLFHMGVVNGGGTSGCRYGYFSDYNAFEFQIPDPQDTVCLGDGFLLQVDRINGATYQWSGPNNFLATGDSVAVQPSVQGHQGQFVVQGNVGVCPIIPDTFELRIHTPPATPQLSYNAPLCQSDTLQLQAQVAAGLQYQWSGPSGFISSVQNPSIPSAQATQAGNYSLVASDSLCASDTAHIIVQVHPVYLDSVTTRICQGDSIWLQNAWQQQSGVYTDHLATAFGCDSIKVTTLFVDPVFNQSQTADICRGQSYSLPDGQQVQQTGTYSSSLQSLWGCDSIIQTQLTVHDTFWTQIQVHICQGDSLAMPNQSYQSQSGIYTFPLQTTAGCDSTLTINLQVNPVHHIQQQAFICQGQNYTLPSGQTVQSAGTYLDTLSSSLGCDSIMETQLQLWPVYHDSLWVTICEGQSHSLPDGQTVQQSGTYISQLSSLQGCDSLFTTFLSVADTFQTNLQSSICQGDSVQLSNGSHVQQTGLYTTNLQSLAGCDSTILHQVQVWPSYQIAWQADFCQGDSLMLPDQSWTQNPGSFNLILPTIHGCDSTFLITISQQPSYTQNDSAFICQGEVHTLANGLQVQTPGIHSLTLSTTQGCDSTLNTQLAVWPSHSFTQNFRLCDGSSLSLPNGQVVHQGGVYTQAFQTIRGCDSVFVYQVSLDPVTTQNETIQLCEGESWPTATGPQNHAGTYIDSLQSQFGCDSIYITEIRVAPVLDSLVNLSLCQGQPVTFGQQTFHHAGIFERRYQSLAGCDSIWTILVSEAPEPIDRTPEDTFVCDQSITLWLDPDYDWQWQHGEQGHKIGVSDTGWYHAFTVDPYGCEIRDSIHLRDGCRPTLFVPNTFTPNGDGDNEIFRAYGTRIKSYTLRIFNRWGDEIFTSNKLEHGWDGTHLNQEVPVGIYNYRIEYQVDSPFPFDDSPLQGKVNLIR